MVQKILFQSRIPPPFFHSIPPSRRNEHFHLDPARLNPSCFGSPPADGQIIAFTILIMYSRYAEMQRLA